MEKYFKGNKLTLEQFKVKKCVKSGKNTTVQSPAGSGKTTILEASAEEVSEQKGLYVAFNRAIAQSASKKFHPSVECRTVHSLGFGGVGWKYKERLSKVTGTMVANAVNMGDMGRFPTPASKGYLVLDTLNQFCYSADKTINVNHTPEIKGPFKEEEMPGILNDITNAAKELWELMLDETSSFPITHDFYLKLWGLSKPTINKDYILLDEAQDANPVMVDILTSQKNSQLVIVGDKFQQIYGWRGAMNAMENINTKHHVIMTQSFRFGQEIAEMANNILTSYRSQDEFIPKIRGFKERNSIVTITPTDSFPDCIICRTNNGVVSNVFKYIDHMPIYIQGGPNQMISLLKGAQDLMNGKRTYASDLALFSSWDEVLECSETESGRDLKALVNLIKEYGIPKLINALYTTCKSAEEADLTITTAHKSKGLEWGHVKLYNDFQTPSEGKRMHPAEANVLYVAATRALDLLDVSECAACHPEVMYDAAINNHK